MSRGTPVKTMRFPLEMVQAIEAAIDSANARRAGVPYDWTEWVRQAVREKLAHLQRARNRKRRRPEVQALATAGGGVDRGSDFQSVGSAGGLERAGSGLVDDAQDRPVHE